jgi:hypothetical protein
VAGPKYFPPPNIVPPFARTAAAGDGVWQALGAAGERAHEDTPVLLQTVIHPHAASPYHALHLVAIDLTRVQLKHVPGTDDHAVARLPASVQPGLIPAADRGHLLAVFNGGFQVQHGYWGMMDAGQVLVPAKDIGCTVATTDQAVYVAPWSTLASEADGLRFFRQTPPCLLHENTIHRQLLARNDRMWGGKNWHEKTRRRSAIGLDASGQVLFYAVGVEVDPLGLAQAMQFAGAVQAAELDINWNWTRFLLYGVREGETELRITSTLLEGMPHNSRSYVTRAEARDFFYLTRKAN